LKDKSLEFLKYIGPGLLVTVGFIDPGNWASNVAAGSTYGYTLLWVVTLSTIMLILLQHNAAHLGIVTGYCLSESASIFLPKYVSNFALFTAMLAAISTAMAEILGGAIALSMLFGLPIRIGAVIVSIFIGFMLLTNSYKKIEMWIIGFVSIIGLSFLIELSLVNLNWDKALIGWATPSFPTGSIFIIMSILGAVVMPHNLFLHSEVIQSRQWNLKDEKEIKRQLKFEFTDTLFSMIIGWAINSAMILLAAATFFKEGIVVNDLTQAVKLLEPLLSQWAALIFAIALLFAGVASTTTAGIAGGSIYSGIFKEPYNIKSKKTIMGISLTIIPALAIIFFVTDPFKGLLISQMLLSMQLPITIFMQLYLTSSKKVMGEYANKGIEKIMLFGTAIIVTGLNGYLIFSLIFK
jgi:manganese transport protein